MIFQSTLDTSQYLTGQLKWFFMASFNNAPVCFNQPQGRLFSDVFSGSFTFSSVFLMLEDCWKMHTMSFESKSNACKDSPMRLVVTRKTIPQKRRNWPGSLTYPIHTIWSTILLTNIVMIHSFAENCHLIPHERCDTGRDALPTNRAPSMVRKRM